MKRFGRSVLFLLILVWFICGVTYAQDQSDSCFLRVDFRVQDATCYYNGELQFAILNSAGEPMTEEEFSQSGYESVKIYYTEDPDGESKEYFEPEGGYHGGYAYVTVDGGTFYGVGVEAYDSVNHRKCQIAHDTTLTVIRYYTEPSATALGATAYSDNGYGRRPSLNCDSTGRVQLIIQGGRLPYTVKVVNSNTNEVLKTVTFTAQQTGTDSTLYNYMNYYSIDNLPGGNWDFYVEDGCGYGLPRTGQTVETIRFPELDYVEIFASAATNNLFIDSNVVKINAVLTSSYDYYTKLLSQYVKYRIIVGDTTGSTIPWKTFPVLQGTNKTTLYDTVTSVHQYCDLWDRDITLQYKVDRCNDTLVSRTFQLHKPNERYYKRGSEMQLDSTIEVNACAQTRYSHTSAFTITYSQYKPSHVEKDDDHDYWRNHYTHPLVWTYTNTVDGSLLKRDTVSFLNSISRLTEDEAKEFFGLDDVCGETLYLTRELKDGNGCLMYTVQDTLTFECPVATNSPSWKIEKHDGDHCCEEISWIRFSEQNSTSVDPDSTVIRLIRSPYSNRFNFTAVYRSASMLWTITKQSLENVANINGMPDGRTVELSGYCLPSGPYTFVVESPCGNDTVTQNLKFPDVYSTELTEAPAYTTRQQCTDMYVKYVAGGVSRVSRNTSQTTGEDLPPVETPMTTFFKVVSGPYGGYDTAATYRKGDSIRISIPGDYVVRIYPDPNMANTMCVVPDFYDTIHYDGGTLKFQFAYAFLCDSSDTHGTAYVKAFNGTPPYQYILYRGSDTLSEVVDTLTIADTVIAEFETDMYYTQEMLCMISDACGSHFPVRFYPRTLAEMQKVWFGDGMKVTTTCEGSTIQVHALEIGTILRYQWFDPDDNLIDTVSSPFLFVERGAKDGYYKVEIEQTGCDTIIRDSVRLNVDVAPTLTVSPGDSVCPGEEVILTFTPHSDYLEGLNYIDTNIYFQVAFETAYGREIRSYLAPSDTTVVDTFIATVNTKVFPLLIDDQRCEYHHADSPDTSFIYIYDSGGLQCMMHTRHDTVCYDGTGTATAWNTTEPPYTLHWYGDYTQTHWLKDETITDGEAVSTYDTAHLHQRTILYVSIEKEGGCPSKNGLVTSSMNLHDDTTALECGMSVRLYDTGGENGDYLPGQTVSQTFHTEDGRPVTIKFDELNLSNSAHLFVISGSRLDADSVLYHFTAGSVPPEIIVSNADTLTLYFIPGAAAAPGWSAIVEHEPGIAIIDVWNRNHVFINDEVCQTNNGYNDIYNIVGAGLATAEELNEAVRNAGIHIYSDTISVKDIHGCDSVVTFTLKVNSPPIYPTQQVLVRVENTYFDVEGHQYEGGFTWEGRLYSETGIYQDTVTAANGCDSVNQLTLIVLEAEISDRDICIGDSTVLGVSVNYNDSIVASSVAQPIHAPGDVLCMVGSEMKVLRPDEFLTTEGVTEVLGVVFYMDPDNLHGKAVALRNAYDQVVTWARQSICQYVHSGLNTADFFTALHDMDGRRNTLVIKSSAESADGHDFSLNAPAAYYCYYYDHRTQTTGTDSLGWYLPACGELGLFHSQQSVVNSTLNKLSATYGAQPMDFNTTNRSYWTSTEAPDDGNKNAWKINGPGQLVKHHSKYATDGNKSTYVRAIYSF